MASIRDTVKKYNYESGTENVVVNGLRYELKPRTVDIAFLVGDVHVGRKTESFDLNVLNERFDILIYNLKYFRRLVQRARMSTRDTALILLGDIVDGESIYPTQSFEQEMTISEQLDYAQELIKRLVRETRVSRIYAVPGNHGRSRKDGTGNWDYMLYRLLQEGCKRPVEILPDTGETVMVGNARVFTFHGYQIRAYQQIPWYGITRYVSRRYMYDPFDMVVLGHFHTIAKYEFNTIPIYLNGSMLTDDELSKKYALKSEPQFWTFAIPVDWKKPLLELTIPLDKYLQ